MKKEILKNSKAFILCHTGVSSKENQAKVNRRIPLAKKVVLDPFRKLLMDENSSPSKSVEAVEMAINIMEDSGLVNAGCGAGNQKDGVKRLDASIMRGDNLEYGAVASLRDFQNPISVAKIIMDTKDGHNMYAHDIAHNIAQKHNLKPIRGLVSKCGGKGPHVGENDTVGSVVRNKRGIICAGTSTGGLANSKPGRIGDSCIIGAGNYSNESCGVSCTGKGENIVKLSISKRITDLVHYHKFTPKKAVQQVLNEYKKKFPGKKDVLGVICVDKEGRFAVDFYGAYMVWAGIVEMNDQYKLIWGTYNDEMHIENIPESIIN